MIKSGGSIFPSLQYWTHKAWLGIVSGLLAIILLPVVSLTADNAYPVVNVWWPSPGAVMDGAQPLKAVLSNTPLADYAMTWSVDGDKASPMYDSYEGSAHKQADVQISDWTWKGAGPYTITFTAYSKSDGSKMATSSITFARTFEAASKIVSPTASAPVAVQPSPTPATTTATTLTTTSAPQTIVPQTIAHLSDAEILSKIGSTPQGHWLTGSDPASDINAVAANNLASLVVYDIPGRDCGSYSAGGAASNAAYNAYIGQIAADINGRSVRVILEPDALAAGCVDTSLLGGAVQTLKNAGAQVFLDAGQATWVQASTMAQRLNAANVAAAEGFSLNVSNFDSNSSEISYGSTISKATGGKHFVIDTSRNGNGTNGQWCNPSGRALGTYPTTNTGNRLLDGLLWIKRPGESDGSCNGGPSAGTFWASYALTLSHNAGW
jgi:endoglucanase